MCVSCVATGAAYGVPALVGLKVHAARLRRRRTGRPAPEPTPLDAPVTTPAPGR